MMIRGSRRVRRRRGRGSGQGSEGLGVPRGGWAPRRAPRARQEHQGPPRRHREPRDGGAGAERVANRPRAAPSTRTRRRTRARRPPRAVVRRVARAFALAVERVVARVAVKVLALLLPPLPPFLLPLLVPPRLPLRVPAALLVSRRRVEHRRVAPRGDPRDAVVRPPRRARRRRVALALPRRRLPPLRQRPRPRRAVETRGEHAVPRARPRRVRAPPRRARVAAEPNPQNPLRRRAEVRRRSVRLRSERSVGTAAFVARLSSDAVDAECAVLAGDGEDGAVARVERDRVHGGSRFVARDRGAPPERAGKAADGDAERERRGGVAPSAIIARAVAKCRRSAARPTSDAEKDAPASARTRRTKVAPASAATRAGVRPRRSREWIE